MFKLNLASPEKKLVAGGDLEEITIPAFRGELNVLPGHAPLMTTLEPGILQYRLKGSSETIKVAISWGYCQISPEAVNVLAENLMLADEIDTKVAAEKLKTFEEKLAHDTLEDSEWREVQHEISRLRAEIELAGH